MSFENFFEGKVEYHFADYGVKAVQFRGPPCDRSQPHIAFLGSTETFGRHISSPFAANSTDLGVANFGAINTGLDFILKTPKLINLANKADQRVLQISSAALQSNEYYKVHPRRNDRVLSVSDMTKKRFDGFDVTDVHFIRHLLTQLRRLDQSAYVQMCQSLQGRWVKQMHHLLDRLHPPVHLVWIAPHDPSQSRFFPLWGDPLFVTDQMIAKIKPRVASYHQVAFGQSSQSRFGSDQVSHDTLAASLGLAMGAV